MGTEKISITLTSLESLVDTGELGSDEPYVIVCSADITNLIKVRTATMASNVLDDVDQGETHAFTGDVAVWGLRSDAQKHRIPAPIPDPEKVIIMVAVVEHDDSSAKDVESTVASLFGGCVTAYTIAGWSRSDTITRLRQDILGAIELGRQGELNDDDIIGDVHVLSLGNGLLDGIAPGGETTKRLVFQNHEDGGRFAVTFTISKLAQA